MYDSRRAERSSIRPYDNSKDKITRPIRLLMHEHVERIVDDARISGDAVRLLLWMLKQKSTYRFIVKNLVRDRLFGGRDKVHALLRQLRAAGYTKIDRDGRSGGGTEPGIYLVASEPTWIDEPAPVDNCEAHNLPRAAQEAEGNAETKDPCFPALHISNSGSNNHTDTKPEASEQPTCRPPKADGCYGSRKADLTAKAERRAGGAKSGLPQTEPRKSAAKGSAMKGLASGAGDETDNDRYIKHLRERLIGAAGYCLANPRNTPGLWKMAEIVIWISMGYELERDILPVIASLSSRAGKEPGHIKSWRFFSEAIRARHAERTCARPAPVRQIAGWTPDRPSRQRSEGWMQAGSAFSGGRRQ
jgi:hypothetical protein